MLLHLWTSLSSIVKYDPVVFRAIKDLCTIIYNQGRSVPLSCINYLELRDLSWKLASVVRNCITVVGGNVYSHWNRRRIASEERLRSLVVTPTVNGLLLSVQTNSRLILVGFNNPVKPTHPQFEIWLLIKIDDLMLFLTRVLSVTVIYFKPEIPFEFPFIV